MGNMHCPAEDAAHLASIARDICPFPNYNPGPHFYNTLFTNSSDYLKNHYASVQASLTPKQLEDFNRGLRSIVGREGKVTLGGVGVVALSLAVLFDTLARQVKGEWVSDSGPIPDLFVKDPSGSYSADIYTVSTYLRLVPHIANNPSRMREETERYVRELATNKQPTESGQHMKYKNTQSIPVLNSFLVKYFEYMLYFHLARINSTTTAEAVEMVERAKDTLQDPGDSVVLDLNCDVEEASKVFLAEVQKSDNRTQEAFKSCPPKKRTQKPYLHFIADLVFMDAVMMPSHLARQKGIESPNDLIAHREDFDLKANALRKWEE